MLDTIVLAFITVLVANIPQGLPPTVTSALTIAAKRMQRRQVYVKRLDAVESLGSASCICSDKTGTLTCNQMSVQNFWFNGSYEILRGGVPFATDASANLVRPPVRPASDFFDSHGNVASERGAKPSQPPPIVTMRPPLRRGSSFSSVGSVRLAANDRWTRNPLEPLLLVCAICNQASFVDEGRSPTSIPRRTKSQATPHHHTNINALEGLPDVTEVEEEGATDEERPHIRRMASAPLPLGTPRHGGEVVVHENNGCCVSCHITGILTTHGHADVRLLQRRRVIDSITRHSCDEATPLTLIHDLQLLLWRGTSKDELRSAEDLIPARIIRPSELTELLSCHDLGSDVRIIG